MRYIVFFLLIIILPKNNFAQGIEAYGGYPFSIAGKMENAKLKNYANGQAGINLMIYIRSVAIQLGAGYMSNNYVVYSDGYRERVSHYFTYVPVMVYPRLYTDGKNTLSVGVGGKVNFPGKAKASIIYDDGNTNSNYKGKYKITVLPRISLRYSRSFAHSFLFFANVFSEFNVMNNFDDGGSGGHPMPPFVLPGTIPSYYSLATVGANVGIGYILPISGKVLPRYFQKREKKIKE